MGALFWLLEPFVPLWSGGALRMDPALAMIFGFGFLLSIPFSIVASFLNYIGDARIGALSRLVTAISSICVAVALAKPLGVYGVAAGLAVGETIGMGMIYLRAASNWVGVGLSHLLRMLVLWIAAGLLPVIAVGQLLPRFVDGSAGSSFVLRAALLAPVLLATILFFGVSRADRLSFWRAAWIRATRARSTALSASGSGLQGAVVVKNPKRATRSVESDV
jgi:O-antigen/teichoic acid export membrane protein